MYGGFRSTKTVMYGESSDRLWLFSTLEACHRSISSLYYCSELIKTTGTHGMHKGLLPAGWVEEDLLGSMWCPAMSHLGYIGTATLYDFDDVPFTVSPSLFYSYLEIRTQRVFE